MERKKKKKVRGTIVIAKNVEVLKSISLDDIIEKLVDGSTYRKIAEHVGVPLSTLFDFIHETPERSARVRVALETSAATYADKAEQVLIDADSDGIEMQRARELAQHYRWHASKRNPRQFGDKVDVTTGGEKLPATIIQWGDKKIQV